MLCYIYDGSFDGLLTAIYEAYYRKEKPDKILARQDNQMNMFDQYIVIPTDIDKASRVYASIRSKISKDALDNVFYSFLSDLEEAPTQIFQYLKLGWKVGTDVDKYITDDRVSVILNTRQKVSFEGHRMLGLIRFSHLSGEIYYAPIEPDYQILGLVAPHFAKRLSDQKWIIHDIKRGTAVFYDKEEWVFKDFDLDHKIITGEREEKYQKLWKEYFDSIAIKNKINPRLQRRNMPIRYWKYLTEKE